MSIQELIFVIGSIVFMIALLPSVWNDDGKPDSRTSVITSAVLGIFSVSYFSMDFYFAAIISLATAILWAILYIQKKGQ